MFTEVITRVPRAIIANIVERRMRAGIEAREALAVRADIEESRTCVCGASFRVFTFAPADAVCGESCPFASLRSRRRRGVK